MTRWHNHYLDNHAHFCTASITDWRPLLTDLTIPVLYEVWEEARRLLSVRIMAYVIMPDHFHIVPWAKRGQAVAEFLHRTTSITRRRLSEVGLAWKERPQVLPIYSAEVLNTKINYLHRNPVRAELVDNPEEWPHSSFRQLALGATDVPLLCDEWAGFSLTR